MQDYEELYKDQLVYNASRTPDGTILESKHRHNFVCHTDVNGFEYCNDGGLEYIRRTFSHGAAPAEDLSVVIGDGHEVVRNFISCGTFGKEGSDPFKWITLAEMSTEHIKAVIRDCAIAPYRVAVYNREIQDRDDGIYEHIAD